MRHPVSTRRRFEPALWAAQLRFALAVLLRERVANIVGIGGLTVGVAACLLALQFAAYEYAYDRQWRDAQRVLRLHTTLARPGVAPERYPNAPAIAAPLLRNDFAQQIETTTRMVPRTLRVRYGERGENPQSWFVDPTFFEIFDVEFLAGRADTALRDKTSMVLLEKTAMSWFGRTDVIGREVEVELPNGGNWIARISGVIREPAPNSHLGLQQVLMRYDSETFAFDNFVERSWTAIWGPTYIKLKPGVDRRAFDAALSDFARRHIPPTAMQGALKVVDILSLSTMPLADLHLHAAMSNSLMRPEGSATKLLFMLVAAAAVLLVALINFVNLSLAQASLRQREVSLRRVLGASRGQLVAQFMLQAVLAAGLAGLLALALVELLMPAFRGFVDRPLPGLGAIGVAATAALVLLLGLAVGALPAWRLSGGRPVQALRANRSSGQVHSARWRSLLVTLQFALAIGLGAALVVAIAQFRHLQRQDRGLDVQGVLSIWGLRWPEVRAGAERFVAEARALPGVVAVGRSSDGPGKLWPSAATASVWAADGQEAAVVSVEPQSVDDEFFAAYRVNVLAGRVLSQQVAADRVDGIGSSTWPADRSINVVIDELASRRLGWAKPEQAIGRPIKVSLSRRDAPAVPATVVGVVRSVQARSAQEAAVPRIYYRNMQDIYFFSVRMAPPQMAQARGELQALWQRSFPRVEYDPVVVADAFEQDLARELRVGQLFGFAAAVALLLAAAGLYALSTFAIQRRAKEMALRRLMGASWQQVGRLLLWQLMRPVLIAAAIACPLAWWGLQDWLNDFEVRVPLSPVHLAGAVGAALAIAWATVASRVWSAAHRAPAQELHDE